MGSVRPVPIGRGADGCVTRCTLMISRPRPTIRSTSSGRAAWSGSSARRVVVSGVVVTWQSSNCARSVLPAWPLKVISYVCDRTGNMPRSWWLTLAVRVPHSEVRVVTRYRVIGLDAVAAAGLHRAVETSEAWQPAPQLNCPVGLLPAPPSRLCRPGSSSPREITKLRGEPAVASLDEVMTWRARGSDAAVGVIAHGGQLAAARRVGLRETVGLWPRRVRAFGMSGRARCRIRDIVPATLRNIISSPGTGFCAPP